VKKIIKKTLEPVSPTERTMKKLQAAWWQREDVTTIEQVDTGLERVKETEDYSAVGRLFDEFLVLKRNRGYEYLYSKWRIDKKVKHFCIGGPLDGKKVPREEAKKNSYSDFNAASRGSDPSMIFVHSSFLANAVKRKK
jgi:hypothetical protein